MSKKTATSKKRTLQVEFICPKCGRHLAWALPTATMNCPQCGRWVTDANRKRSELVEVYMPQDSDQLVLFSEEECG